MANYRLTATAGSDGFIHLDVPASVGCYDVVVSLTVQPKVNIELLSDDEQIRRWNAMLATAGSIDDESFVRQPQCDFCGRS